MSPTAAGDPARRKTWSPADVASAVQGCLESDDTFALTVPTFAPEVDGLLQALTLDKLTLAGAKIAGSTAPVSVAGTASVLGPVTANVTMTFGVADGGALAVTLQAGFVDAAPIKILGLDWAAVDDLVLELDTTGPALLVPVVSGALSGKVELEGLPKPIDVTLRPTLGTDWTLSASGIPLPSPATLTKLMAVQDAAAVTPPSLDLSGCSIDLSCGFDPSDMKVRSLDATIDAPTWTFADHFELTGVSLSVGLDFTGGDGNGGVDDTPAGGPAVTVSAAATVRFPPTAKSPDGPELSVAVSREPPDQWCVAVLADTFDGSLGDLVKAGHPEAASLLPTGLSSLPTVESASLELTLGETSPTPGETSPTLRSVFFDITLDKWTIVDGCEVDGVVLQVQYDAVAGSASGFVTGDLQIDGFDLPVAVEVQDSTTWTLSMGAEAANDLKGLGSLAAVAGGDVSAHLPKATGFGEGAVTLKDLSVSFAQGAVQSARLSITSAGPWPIPGTEHVDVEALSLDLATTSAPPTVTGVIAGTVNVDDAAITITASKPTADAAWTFEGKLDEPKPVDLFAFASTFGFDPPAALQGATLTGLDIKFDTTGGFTFTSSGTFRVDGQTLELELNRNIKGTTATFDGSLTIDGRTFMLEVGTNPSDTRVVAAYTQKDKISIAALVAAVSPAAAQDIPDTLTVELNEVLFATASGGGSTRVLFALDLGGIELPAVPLLGSVLSVEDIYAVAARPAPAAKQGDDPGDIAAWNELLKLANLKQIPAQGVGDGVSVSALVKMADASAPLALPATAAKPTPPAASDKAAATDDTKWYPVQRTLGPVYVGRVGARYDAGTLWLLVDASLTLGGLSFSLMGLSAGSPLDAFKPQFNLDGLALAYSQDPLQIAGSFLALPGNQLGSGTEYEYDGSAVVRAETFTLAAFGSYAKTTSGDLSLFVFAELLAPLGGPPALYVTGLMGGFGYNRSLRIPGQDEVFQFPFLLAEPPTDPRSALAGWLKVAPGVDWLAAGITFTSFEVVKSQALLIAEFGQDFQLALIGLSKLTLPDEGTEKFAYLELQLEAVLKPNEGFFGLTAQLTPNSYVIDPACRLTGGFAFYVWFAGEHAGDFVLTLGGYHPAFPLAQYPHYPQEPRLGLQWPVNDLVTIDGSAYFALTPSCVMAGGGLHVLFHDGNLQAWLTASADFLVGWEPFSYSASIGVSVGVSYRIDWGLLQKTLSVEVGAQLELAGPPTHGTASISWYVISFSISFGDDHTSETTMTTWDDFAQPLLPKDELGKVDLCKVAVQSGLLAGADPKVAGADPKESLVRADALQLATECAVPATELRYGTQHLEPDQAPAIRPLGLASFGSMHTLQIKDSADNEVDYASWSIKPRQRDMPEALWGAPLPKDADGKVTKPPPGAKLVPGQLVGLVITPPASRLGPNATKTLCPNAVGNGTLPVDPKDVSAAPGTVDDDAVLKAVAGIAAAETTRGAVRSVLQAQAFDPGTDDKLDSFASQAAFPVPPLLKEAKKAT